MATKKEVIKIIFNCIEEINQQNGSEIPKNINTRLIGSEGELDSLVLVNLIVGIEDTINNEYNLNISIVDEKAMSQMHSPFKSVDTLAHYIKELIDDHQLPNYQ